jgi:hypothetical protein
MTSTGKVIISLPFQTYGYFASLYFYKYLAAVSVRVKHRHPV